jgi:hypothetical protein
LVPKDVADRRRDIPLGEKPRRELIEQRLKQVVIRPVDDGDLDIGAAQRFRRKESAESAADDHDLVPAHGGVRLLTDVFTCGHHVDTPARGPELRAQAAGTTAAAALLAAAASWPRTSAAY